MARIIDNRTSMDQTIKIFDSFYSVNMVVGANQYDVVHGYFISVCGSPTIANNFTAALFRVAQEIKVDVLELLTQLQTAGSKMQMNQIMSYYLNSFKSKTSLYGVGAIPRPNQPVSRNIVQ